jgi:hypothetical protein
LHGNGSSGLELQGGITRGVFIGEGYGVLRKDYSTDSISNSLLESMIPLGFDRGDKPGLVLIQDKPSSFDPLLRFHTLGKGPRRARVSGVRGAHEWARTRGGGGA